jgi:hypothetical protein
MNKELLSRIICQEVLYYKFSLADTTVNAYGEAKSKFYYPAVVLNCFIRRSNQATTDVEYGPDESQALDFAFLRDDLQLINLVPERGDIISDRNLYFEVDNIVENQLAMGKYPEYAITTPTQNFGTSLSIIVNTHHTRQSKLNITRERL